jgi:ADP-heptose:LPS heptosyltransferase
MPATVAAKRGFRRREPGITSGMNDIGPVGPPLADVRRIAVLRGGGLGDLMFVLPAVAALRAAYPAAQLVLLGTPSHAELLADRPGPVDRVQVLPVATGVHQSRPTGTSDLPTQAEFFRRVGRFDLAVQAHGGGRWSNPFLRRLDAQHTIGTRTPDAEPLDRSLPYHYHQHEALRWLELVGLVGATGPVRARLAVTDADRAATPDLPRPLVTVHPGATDPRRRWPAAGFAAVAAWLAASGVGVVVIGSADEGTLVADVVRRADHPLVHGLAGRLSLAGLVGTLAASAVVLANDSGPRHIADAIGVPTVSVFWCGNVINAAPFGRGRHRVHIGWTTRCPACGHDLTVPNGQTCDHEDSWVAGVTAEGVLADVCDLLSRRSP